MYNKYYNTQRVKILITFFGYPKHNKKLKNLHNNMLELKVNFESKIDFDPTIK